MEDQFPSAATSENLESLILFLVHDLEGPLAAAQSVLRLFDRNRYDQENLHHRQLLQTTHVALRRAQSIIGDLLAVGKLESGQWSPRMENLSTRQVIQESIELVSALADECEVSIVVSPQDKDFAVIADSKLLPRVIDNLLFNAVRNTPDRGEVRILVTRLPEHVKFDITNPTERKEDT